MSTKPSIATIKRLQARLDRLREERRVSSPSALLYQAFLDSADEEEVVVEADGFGGATTSVVEGNYPIDYNVKKTKKFRTEQAAIEAAEQLVEESAEPETVLGR